MSAQRSCMVCGHDVEADLREHEHESAWVCTDVWGCGYRAGFSMGVRISRPRRLTEMTS